MDEKTHLKVQAWLIHTAEGREELRRLMSLRREKSKPACIICGLCCKNSGCKYYDDKRKCTIWYQLVQYPFPMICKLFPMFPEQLEIRNIKDHCRYYWPEGVKLNYAP